jgi:hypothetical protein
MVSDRLNRMIRNPIARTYLEAVDGRWADAVLREFSFLEDRGGVIDFVNFHQTGDTISYSERGWSLELRFAPDNFPGGEWLSADLETGRVRRRIGSSRDFDGTAGRSDASEVDERVMIRALHSWALAVGPLIDRGP